MPAEIRVPEMGESITEATVARWMKREGDRVQAGEPVVELETEKVNTEVPAQQGGVLGRLMKQEGETVKISDVLVVIDDASSADAPSAQQESPEQTAAPTQPPPAEDRETPHLVPASERAQRPGRQVGADDGVEATPVARNVAAEHGVELSSIEGTGPGGRITKEDVLAYVERKGTPQAPPDIQPRPSVQPDAQPSKREEAAPPQERPVFAEPLPEAERGEYEERVRLSRRRQTIARRLVEAQREAAATTTYNEVDMGAVMDLRRRQREAFRQRHGVDLGLMPFFVKAAVTGLGEFPNLNSELQGDELVLKYYYHIGIAVASEEGLVVPVLRHAGRLSFAEIEERIQDIVERTQKRRLTLEDLRDGTFTITNGGVFGSLWSSPVLNPPQAGILGMHRIQERPVVRDGHLVARPMMYVALTYDHRIVDGEPAVRFLARLKQLLEEPALLLLEG